MPEASVFLLLFFVSWLASVLDVDIMHTRAPVISTNDSVMTGGSPRNDLRIYDGLNWPGPYSWYRVSFQQMCPHRVEQHWHWYILPMTTTMVPFSPPFR